jgi:hypothetical protein
MEFIKKLFRKKEYNNKNNNMAQVDKGTIFVWQKSERAGRIVIADKIDGNWLVFEDGSKINKTLTDEYLFQCSSNEQAMEISQIHRGFDTQPVVTNNVTEEVEPTVTINHKESNKHTTGTERHDPDDLMVGILEKLSKKNKTSLDVSVGVNLPSKTIFRALQQDVDDDELKRGLEKLVKKQINNIEDQLNKQVKSFIQNYYYEQKRKKTSL